MKFEDIKAVFNNNNNEWMTSIEVYNYFNNGGYKWSENARGIQGHKNILARDLSERYRNKFEIDKNSKPQKYRLRNLDYDKKNDYEVADSEISIDISRDNEHESECIDTDKERNQDNVAKEDSDDTFILDFANLQFQEYNMPLEGKSRKGEMNRKNTPRKLDYEKKAKRNKNKGDLGEEAVLIMEKNKLISLGREDLVKHVEWVSKKKGDGLGYDIVSWKVAEKEVEKIYIEVKTTTGDISTPFDISDKEVSVSKEFGDRYYIYRLFGIEKVTNKINYYIIEGDVEKKFDLIPTSFKAYLKTD